MEYEKLLDKAYSDVVAAIKDEYEDANTRKEVVVALIEQLKFNIKGTKAEIADKPFDWSSFTYDDKDEIVFDDFIINIVFGNILMDYTIKASYEEIVELDEYLVNRFEKEWLR